VTPRTSPVTLIRVSMLVAGALLVASWYFILLLDRQAPHPFFSATTLHRGGTFLRDLLGVNATRQPAFLSAEAWASTAALALRTVGMSILAVGIAAAGALVTFVFAARTVMLDELSPSGGGLASRAWYLIIRGLYAITRGVPELIWAMLAVFVFTPGILPGAIALGLHNLGIIGKLSAEIVEGLDARPALALRAAGAGRFQILFYAILPQALPRFMTYVLYRWEVIIRTTLVVGFVAAGGLGMQFRLAMSQMQYTTVTLLLLWYLILVLGVDTLAAVFRRLAR